MSNITTVGLDLAKNVFHLVATNSRGEEIKRKVLKRSQMLAYFATLPRCLIGMEACSGSHDWARRLQALGFEVRLISAQYVKAYVVPVRKLITY